ncbi:tRNA pseudouridine(55) synthase TruB [Candidatus Falkowbacteria bacterium CG10_big_fil_rev_8_21_14_0_10_43_10]|uniref:tRNA pseudouridine synthase B n=1 Tax=Candidatus Falkowbacteria bacterium CG10_big_fil_rev_8_21_14_0_10_43_10 TaxID=1974567 RepID=A0A2H0V1S5_9BACT|nr:MAG: tRNA pseudouridine(55) synthase TruB [Candidatus Falkowbacteria bacterium CG10_big_fil_rev_8_21_14_0_10_43_10]
MSDIFAVYKPKGPTSRQVLNQIQKITRSRKVGHAGTLDPLAEGVLVVGIGREATKQLATAVQKEKEYLAKIRLGMISSTDDEEGIKKYEGTGQCPVRTENIEKVIKKFVGKIMQTPPVYSAVKIKGREAYKRARKGEEVKMRPRAVEIKKIEILKYKWPYLEIKVVTGPGVYIRSLARDIGRELKTGGYLAGLIRTRVGEFDIKKAVEIDKIGICNFMQNPVII